jgi:hypothetical protein
MTEKLEKPSAHHSTHWMTLATKHFPEADITQPADLYHHLAREIARGVVKARVELVPDAQFHLHSMEIFLLLEEAKAGGQAESSAVDAIAYRLGYAAQMQDAQSGSHTRLDDMLAVLMQNEPHVSIPHD